MGMNGQDVCQLYVDLLVEALKLFYKNDADELFKGDPVDERAMVGCIARYVWWVKQAEKFKGLKTYVDVEYNKMHQPNIGAMVKAFDQVADCMRAEEGSRKCLRYEKCGQMIQARINEKCDFSFECRVVDCSKNLYRFRPDLIVHERGVPGCEGGNGLIVEFKKEQECKRNEAKEAVAFDLAKVRYCTCKKRDFKYEVGVFVMLRSTKADICVFVNGRKRGRWVVAKNGSRKYVSGEVPEGVK